MITARQQSDRPPGLRLPDELGNASRTQRLTSGIHEQPEQRGGQQHGLVPAAGRDPRGQVDVRSAARPEERHAVGGPGVREQVNRPAETSAARPLRPSRPPSRSPRR